MFKIKQSEVNSYQNIKEKMMFSKELKYLCCCFCIIGDF